MFIINFCVVYLKTARYFITRALLGVENYVQAQETLRNEGCGAAEGFSVNMTFLNQEGDRMFHNAEIGPVEEGGTCSKLSIHTASPGENLYHCNKYALNFLLSVFFFLFTSLWLADTSGSRFRRSRV